MLALQLRNLFYLRLNKRAGARETSGTKPGLERSAVVFSPHFDDETLGCGGTIIKKVEAGAEIRIVFMTDGSASHRQLMSRERLREIRSREGMAAAECLGIEPRNVFLLDFREGRLGQSTSEAGSRVREILNQFSPAEVYIPHSREPLLWSSDHLETSRIVRRELSQLEKSPVVMEYPIWYWFHWPWVGVELTNRSLAKIILLNTFAYRFGLRALWDFNYGVRIDDVLDRKRTALSRHASQMTRLISDRRWMTLGDMAGGAFLECFFCGLEVFRRTPTA